MLNLICYILNEQKEFTVAIDEDKAVDDLTLAIKNRVAPTLDNVSLLAITLSRINVDISDDQEYLNIIGRMSRGEHEFTKSPLIPSREISHYFKTDSGRTIEVLVELAKVVRSICVYP
jgi:hypothetical protein